MRPGRPHRGGLAIGLALLAGAPSALGSASPAGALDAARLGGVFQMTGVITKAVGIRGERRGQHVERTWAFLPSCSAGACPTVLLVRHRRGGTDQVLLHHSAAARYSGTGAFLAPLRCRGRRYGAGELVPFTITVQITGAAVSAPIRSATTLRARYHNAARLGLTPCFSAPSYDSARYYGSPARPGAISRVRRTWSRTGS